MAKFSSRFVLVVVLSLVFFSSAATALAAATTTQSSSIGGTVPTLAVQIGNSDTKLVFKTIDCATGGYCAIPWIGEYIAAMFKYGVGLAAMLAVIMMMIGGFVWLSSGGSPDRIGKAKEFISSALIGLFLALFSYLMLYTINPRLVASESILVPNIQSVTYQSVCCNDGTWVQQEQKGDVTVGDSCSAKGGIDSSAASCGICCNCDTSVMGSGTQSCMNLDSGDNCPSHNATFPNGSTFCVRAAGECSSSVRRCTVVSAGSQSGGSTVGDSQSTDSQTGSSYASGLQTAAIGERLNKYVDVYGGKVTSGLRSGEPRHGSGYVVDMSYKSGSTLTNYVTSNKTQVKTLSWGTAYYMPDGTVFVKEADSESQSGYHWHVEFVSTNWRFIPER